jgi:hypothetical protein
VAGLGGGAFFPETLPFEIQNTRIFLLFRGMGPPFLETPLPPTIEISESATVSVTRSSDFEMLHLKSHHALSLSLSLFI